MTEFDGIYVIHMTTDLVFMGSKQECEAYQADQTYRTDCWKICKLEDWGDACFSEGYDSGYDCGAEND